MAGEFARKEMSQLDLAGKRVLIREDLNVPIKDGVISNDARIRAALPTLRQALDAAGLRTTKIIAADDVY